MWRFTSGIGPTKSADVLGPQRSQPCSVHFGDAPQRQMSEYLHVGVVLTPSLSWVVPVCHLIVRGIKLFGQRLVVPDRTPPFAPCFHPLLHFRASQRLMGFEFCSHTEPSFRLTDRAF